jgi:hypoxanthine phosphoribosyltransferase
MNKAELINLKGDLYELIQDNHCETPKQILLKNIQQLFLYIDKLQDTGQTLENIKQQLQKLEQKQEMYLLTKTNFGPAAYLHKVDEERWQVITDDDAHVTGGYLEPKMALDEYVTQCESDDFIHDFVVGVQDGTCEFGDSDYAVYVEKCFNSYVFGKGLQ